ncbi:MAG TPA: type II toxin-antitoxin system RelE/ParE family toxin [Stellaceae bacterium]
MGGCRARADISEQSVHAFCAQSAYHGCRALRGGVEYRGGLINADLGGGVIKQRIARQGGGKSGGFRALILLRVGERAFFVHGFAKSDRDNIRDDELVTLKRLAGEMLNYDDAALAKAIAAGVLTEVMQ